MDRKIILCILANDQQDDHRLWMDACNAHSDIVEYDVVDLTGSDWIQKLSNKKYDYFLAKPPGIRASIKQLYDERIHILAHSVATPIMPQPQEIYIYENKRYFYSWLKAHNLPHPKTDIFYFQKEAMDFLNSCKYPVVAKNNIGASGSGVIILHNKSEAVSYVKDCFSQKGAPRRWGPNLSKGGLLKRGFHYVLRPGDIRKKLDVYQAVKSEKQKYFVVFQEYIPHDFEWRIVAIGDSYFAHKKLKNNEKASGSLLKGYENPPLKLFRFAKNLMDRFHFTSQAIDLFETNEGELLINEMQCIFGQSDPYQMLVNSKPGRYRFKNEKWLFEEGEFNENQSYNLRLEWIINQLEA